jgi:hypothetical protein
MSGTLSIEPTPRSTLALGGTDMVAKSDAVSSKLESWGRFHGLSFMGLMRS